MITPVAEIVMVGVEYVAYVHGKEVSKGRSLVKVSKSLASYIKGQE